MAEDRSELNVCPKCKQPTLRFMVDQTISAPMSMYRNLTRMNLRSKEIKHWGTNWQFADIICNNADCGYTALSKEKREARK